MADEKKKGGWMDDLKACFRAVYGTDERLRRQVGSDPVAISAVKIDRLVEELSRPTPALSIEEALNHIQLRQ